MSDVEPRSECVRCQELEQRMAELEAQVNKLTAALEAATRKGKRQAAPFRKPKKKAPAKKPGRKSGEDHGQHLHRLVPEQIDEILEAPLPGICDCGSCEIHPTGMVRQYQTEIIRAPWTRQFNIHVGHCLGCKKRVQGRHELQTSDALGAANSQLGPEAHAAIAFLNKTLGLSHGKTAQLFEHLFGISINRSSSCRSMLRTAHRNQELYQQIRRSVRGSPQVVADETGWRIGGDSAWLHVFVGDQATCYEVASDRSHQTATQLLGDNWNGRLIHDGYSVYDRFPQAIHQQCVAHLMRRCKEILETATQGAVHFPRRVLTLLKEGLAVRHNWRNGGIDEDEQALEGLKLSYQLQILSEGNFSYEPNRKMAKHILRHSNQWFMYLIFPELDATNYRAEQAIRPAVVNRKVWGGNRTRAGAKAQSILTSVLQTISMKGRKVIDHLAKTISYQKTPTLIPQTR